MHRFYFNECLPPNEDLHHFVSLLSTTVLEFDRLKKDHASVASMVVTEKLPDTMIVCGQYSLADAIGNIDNRDLRTIAFQVFDKSYPISAHFEDDDELVDDILGNEYKLMLGAVERDATNLAIVAKNNGLLFSVSLTESLAINKITLQPNKQEGLVLSLVNLYGEKANTDFVSTHIQAIDAQSFSKLDQLRQTLGTHYFNNTFEKGFVALSSAEQNSIIVHFERAIARNARTQFAPDGNLVKECILQNKRLSVCELRIFSPTSLRIYFHEYGNTIFIANVEHKSNSNQNSDMVKSEKILYRLTLTS